MGCLPSLRQEWDAIVLIFQHAVLLVVSHIPVQVEVQSPLVLFPVLYLEGKSLWREKQKSQPFSLIDLFHWCVLVKGGNCWKQKTEKTKNSFKSNKTVKVHPAYLWSLGMHLPPWKLDQDWVHVEPKINTKGTQTSLWTMSGMGMVHMDGCHVHAKYDLYALPNQHNYLQFPPFSSVYPHCDLFVCKESRLAVYTTDLSLTVTAMWFMDYILQKEKLIRTFLYIW